MISNAPPHCDLCLEPVAIMQPILETTDDLKDVIDTRIMWLCAKHADELSELADEQERLQN